MLKLHFLNVGHGDCIIIEFPSNRIAIVDINNGKEMDEESVTEILNDILISESLKISLLESFSNKEINSINLLEQAGYSIQCTNPIEYIKDNIQNSEIFRFISTHPHMDHLSGLSLIENNIYNFWISENNYTQNSDKLSKTQKDDWAYYKKLRNNIGKKVDGVTVLSLNNGVEGSYYSDDGIKILAPNENLKKLAKEKNNANILSTVLLIEYAGHKVVLGGDAEEDTWNFIMENSPNLIKDITILKASHHGRNSGYHMESIKKMNPKYTIVSVGKKPKQDASNKYRNFSENVFSTRWKGNMVFTITSDGKVSYETEYDR